DPIRILGVTSHFNVEAFFGSVLVATFKTSDPENMKKFMAAYLGIDPKVFENIWQDEQNQILAILKEDSFGAKDIQPDELHAIKPWEVQVAPDGKLATLVHGMLKLFHNMRAALHVPDKPPEKIPPASGPGRN